MNPPGGRALAAFVIAAACASGRTASNPSSNGDAAGAAAANSAPNPVAAPNFGPDAGPSPASAADAGAAAKFESDAGPGATSAPASAGATTAPLPSEEGAVLYATACTSCHTSELVVGSRISLKGWGAEIAKMRKWGALVDEEQAAPFAAWLAERYPVGEQPPPAGSMTAAAARATVKPQQRGRPGNAESGRQIYAQACASCHGVAALGLGGGPCLVDNPVVEQSDRFAKLVRNGQGRMPGFEEVTAAQVADLRAWLQRPQGRGAGRDPPDLR